MNIDKPDGLLVWDEHWNGYVLGSDAEHRFLWLWQGFNIRLIAVPQGMGDPGYEHAWCFPRDPEAVETAAADWNPETQDEPTGWHKRATHPPRLAPHRDQEPGYNRPRCLLGCSLADGCRTINCPELLTSPFVPVGA